MRFLVSHFSVFVYIKVKIVLCLCLSNQFESPKFVTDSIHQDVCLHWDEFALFVLGQVNITCVWTDTSEHHLTQSVPYLGDHVLVLVSYLGDHVHVATKLKTLFHCAVFPQTSNSSSH